MNENWKTVELQYCLCEFREDGSIEYEMGTNLDSLEGAKLEVSCAQGEYPDLADRFGVLRVTRERLQ
jgi:hypothetical protein